MLVWRPGPQSSLPVPSVNNVVATFSVGRELNLVNLCLKYPFCEYQPARFAALTVRCRSPRTTCLAFGSGKFVCTGAKTPCQ